MILFDPLISFDRIEIDELNASLIAWGHKMGPLNRPQFCETLAHGIRLDGMLVAVTATDQMIAAGTCGLDREQAFELSRVCAREPGWCRAAVRLWRLAVFPAVARARKAPWAISYQDAAQHSGNLYRFDGWVRLGRTRSGTDKRGAVGVRRGRDKFVWGWCDDAAERAARKVAA